MNRRGPFVKTAMLATWLGILAGASCLDSTTALCPSGLRCLPGHRCVQTAEDWTCIVAGCGDGVASGDEVCDDGNRLNGDGCSADCSSDERCSNGIVDAPAGEECDDSNDSDSDSCTTGCKAAHCGDGHVNLGVEQCDGDAGCTTWCERLTCANQQHDPGEADVDCGGACNKPCAHGQSCESALDCYSGLCRDGRCDGRQLVAGMLHACLLLEDGRIGCWGNNDIGLLGRDHGEDIGDDECPAPEDMGFSEPVVQLVAGGTHTCALLGNGDAHCWGNNPIGQLGTGNLQGIGNDEEYPDWSAIDLGGPAVRLTAGDSHTCALMQTGSVRCWGANHYGQLGLGHTRPVGDNETPAEAGYVFLGDGAVVDIAAGHSHTCAVVNPVGRGKCDSMASACVVRCWGENVDGRLGLGHTERIGDDDPPGVSPNVAFDRSVTRVFAFTSHTCAITDDGALHCWGNSSSGQLGLGHFAFIGDDEVPRFASQVDLGLARATQVVSWGQTCTLTDGGDVYCWGNNSRGQLGYGDTRPRGDSPDDMPPPAVRVGGEQHAEGPVIDLAVGEDFTCALRSSGTVRCWGGNRRGRLGRGFAIDAIGDDEHPDEVEDGCPPWQ